MDSTLISTKYIYNVENYELNRMRSFHIRKLLGLEKTVLKIFKVKN